MDIGTYRRNESERLWDLPPWGHPLSQGVMPLFLTVSEHLIPIGTAFSIGKGVAFMVTAAHNVREALKWEGRLTHLLTADAMPEEITLKHVGFSLLHHRQEANGRIHLTLWPLETIDGAPPTDIVFGYPEFSGGLGTLINLPSFDLPTIGERLWSVGYTEFRYPEGGIPIASVVDGTFDWKEDYGHRLVVVEAFVEHIFAQRFASGYAQGICFTVDAEILHGQSGGPLFVPGTAIVRGVNSAGVTMFFNKPTTLASSLCPLLFVPLRFGLSFGPQFRMNGKQPMISLIEFGTIPTDGSETRVPFAIDGITGRYSVRPGFPAEMASHVHDDFSAFQSGAGVTKWTGESLRFRRVES